MDPKKLFVLVLVFAFIGCATMATKPTDPNEGKWSGAVNPFEFDTKWKLVQKKMCYGGGRPHMHAWIKNPDPKAKVQIVETVIYPPNLMVGYSYKLDGKIHHFKYDRGVFREFTVPQKTAKPPKSI